MRKYKVILSALLGILLAVPIMLVACNDNTPPVTPYFPVLKEPESIYPESLAMGRLSIIDNCLRLKPGESLLLIWPYGYTLAINGGEISVVDNKGHIVARVGDSIKVGGGEIPLEIVEKYIGGPLPDNCTGPYWLVSHIVE